MGMESPNRRKTGDSYRALMAFGYAGSVMPFIPGLLIGLALMRTLT